MDQLPISGALKQLISKSTILTSLLTFKHVEDNVYKICGSERGLQPHFAHQERKDVGQEVAVHGDHEAQDPDKADQFPVAQRGKEPNFFRFFDQIIFEPAIGSLAISGNRNTMVSEVILTSTRASLRINE